MIVVDGCASCVTVDYGLNRWFRDIGANDESRTAVDAPPRGCLAVTRVAAATCALLVLAATTGTPFVALRYQVQRYRRKPLARG